MAKKSFEPKATRWVRCRTAMTLHARANDHTEHVWPGLVVSLDRELAPGYTIADAIAGREGCFEAVNDPTEGEDAE